MKNLFNILNKAIDSITDNELLELCIQVFFNKYVYIYKSNDDYLLRTYNDVRFRTKSELLKYLLIYNIISIQIYGSIDIIYINKILYDFKNNSINIIQKGYRKYKLRTARIKNDLVIRGLSEYWFHPSRISFNI